VLLKVFLHRGLVDELFLALGVRTAERPLARVRPDVLVEDGLLAEALGALRAHVRLLARVYPDVLVQNRFLPEGLLVRPPKKKQKRNESNTTIPFKVSAQRSSPSSHHWPPLTKKKTKKKKLEILHSFTRKKKERSTF